MTKLKRMDRPVSERLKARVKETENGCLEYQGARLSTGYGYIKKDGRMRLAHRVVWELENGPIPQDIFVLHKCDNPPCCNPDHLFLGDQTANLHDMTAKGRRAEGEQHGNASVPDALVAKAVEFKKQGLTLTYIQKWLRDQGHEASESSISMWGRVARLTATTGVPA